MFDVLGEVTVESGEFDAFVADLGDGAEDGGEVLGCFRAERVKLYGERGRHDTKNPFVMECAGLAFVNRVGDSCIGPRCLIEMPPPWPALGIETG